MSLLEKATILHKRHFLNWHAIKSYDDEYELLNIALNDNRWFLQGFALNLVNKDFDLGDIDITLDAPTPQYYFNRFNKFPFNFDYSKDYPKFCDEIYSKFKKHPKYKSEYVWEFAKIVLKELLEEDNGKNLDKVDNDKALIEIALTTYNEDLKYKIIHRYGFELFSYMAKQRLGYNISKAYLKNYLNQNTLKYIALNDPNKYVTLKAIENISDNNLLYEIFEKANIEIRIKCIYNMTDSMMLNKLYRDDMEKHNLLYFTIRNRLEKVNNNKIKIKPPISHSICLNEVDALIKNAIFTNESILEYIINNSSKPLQTQASNKLKNEYKLFKKDMKIIAIKELE